MGVDKPEGNEAAVTGFGGIDKLKRRDAVLAERQMVRVYVRL